MENNFPFHHLSPIDNMMSNIMAEGVNAVWNMLEEETDAFKRVENRKIYTLALNKIKKGK